MSAPTAPLIVFVTFLAFVTLTSYVANATVSGTTIIQGIGRLRGIAVNEATATLYAIDSETENIARFDVNGTMLAPFNTHSPPLNDPIDIVCVQHRFLLVSDYGNQRIVQMSFTGAVTDIFTTDPPMSPWNIDVDTSGNIYVCDMGNGAVLQLSSSGQVIKRFNAHGKLDKNVFAVAVDRYNQLYVQATAGIYQLDTKDNVLALFIVDVNTVTALRISPSTGLLYVSGDNTHVQQVNTTTGATVATYTPPYTTFDTAGVAVDVTNTVYIADYLARIIRMNDTTTVQTLYQPRVPFSTPGGIVQIGNTFFVQTKEFCIEKLQILLPSQVTVLSEYCADNVRYGVSTIGLATDSMSNLYFAHVSSQLSITKLDSKTSQVLQEFILEQPCADCQPSGLAVDNDLNLYACTFYVGGGIFKFSSNGTNVDYFNVPNAFAIAVGPDMNVYVTILNDKTNILKLDRYGQQLAAYSVKNAESLVCITVDMTGNIYVCDTGMNGRVIKLSSDGTELQEFLMPEQSPRQNFPTAITITNGTILVTDSRNSRLIAFEQSGSFLQI